jgi:hypothetical protein
MRTHDRQNQHVREYLPEIAPKSSAEMRNEIDLIRLAYRERGSLNRKILTLPELCVIACAPACIIGAAVFLLWVF